MQDQEQMKMEQILCSRHRKNPILCIAYLKDHAKFLCEDCLIQLQQEKPQLQLGLLIYIKKALEDPVYVINQLREYQNKNENFDVFFDKLDQLNNHFQELVQAIIGQLQEVQKEFTNNYLKIKLNANNLLLMTQEMSQNQNFQEIIKQLDDCKNNSDAFNQIEKKLYEFLHEQKNKRDYVIEFQKNYEQTMVNTYLDTQEFKKLRSLVTNLMKSQTQLQINTLCQFTMNSPSEICHPQYFKNLFAERLQNCNYQKIIHQIKSEFAWQKLYQQLLNKSNLLFIFKSQSNYVFGGFSPCKVTQSNQYVQDCSCKSFIFSATNQKIFDINRINTSDAFLMNTQQIRFSQDLVISSNFSDGYSQLGTSYFNIFQMQYPEDYLFGQDTPQLVEFEIFQIFSN